MLTWSLSDDVLQLSTGDSFLPVTAEQVYSTVVEKTPLFDGLATGEHGDASGVTFTKHPVYVSIVLCDDLDSGLPSIELLATSQRNVSFPMSQLALYAGHVVYNNTWYPCDLGSKAIVLDLLDEVSFNKIDLSINSLKDILHLKRSSYIGLPVFDKLSEQSIGKLLKNYSKSMPHHRVLAKLYPYQQDGWKWLLFIVREGLGAILADEMGLGKTLQSICAISAMKSSFPNACFLVVCPGSILENWRREVAHFCPTLTLYKHHGPNRTGDPKVLTTHDVVITSYDTAVRDLSMFKMITWRAIILDEAQNIKNPNSLRASSIKQLFRYAGIAITGTPIENYLRDMWSIFDFISPGYLGKLSDFENNFTDDIVAAKKLEPVVSPIILRRTVREVASDLPDRLDVPEILEFSQDEAVAYENMRTSILQQYGRSAALVSITKLRQFCSHPNILDVQVTNGDNEFTKFQRLRELIDEIASLGEKVLVFTSYTNMADMIVSMVNAEFHSSAAFIDGRVDVNHRQAIIDEFSSDANFLLLALNPRAAGTGLNISAANHVIHYNLEWNPALIDQATARSYRRGQERPVTVRRMIFCGTVEEVIEERLQRKRTLADTAVVGVNGSDKNYSDIISALQRSPVQSGL